VRYLSALLTYKWYILSGLAILLLLGIGKVVYDKNLIDKYVLKEQVELEKGARKADAKASNRRLRDTLEIEKIKRDYNEAIDSAESSVPAPSSVALNCERLLRAGYKLSELPACGGR
jgi:hypothetical protein